jgi:hypothetical protein
MHKANGRSAEMVKGWHEITMLVGRAKIRANYRINFLEGRVLQALSDLDSGVVDKDVDRTELRYVLRLDKFRFRVKLRSLLLTALIRVPSTASNSRP